MCKLEYRWVPCVYLLKFLLVVFFIKFPGSIKRFLYFQLQLQAVLSYTYKKHKNMPYTSPQTFIALLQPLHPRGISCIPFTSFHFFERNGYYASPLSLILMQYATYNNLGSKVFLHTQYNIYP